MLLCLSVYLSQFKIVSISFSSISTSCQRDLEYTDCIPCRGLDSNSKKWDIFDMTQKSI